MWDSDLHDSVIPWNNIRSDDSLGGSSSEVPVTRNRTVREFSHPLLTGLCEAHDRGRSLVLLFDYDGTLVPLTEHPRDARLPASTRKLLRTLSEQDRVFVGVLSGRSINDLREMVGLPGLYYVGTSGLEVDLLGVEVRHPRAEQANQLLTEVLPALGELVTRYPGSWIERKPMGLTLHYRQLMPLTSACLRCDAMQILEPQAGLHVVEAMQALEITPALGWTKGVAVQRIVEDAARGAIPLYAGDAANDTDALATATILGGYAVGVGPNPPTTARYRLKDSTLLVDLLRRFTQILTNQSASPD